MLHKLFKSVVAIAVVSFVVTGVQAQNLKDEPKKQAKSRDLRLLVKFIEQGKKGLLAKTKCYPTDKESLVFTQEDIERCINKASYTLGTISHIENPKVKVSLKGTKQDGVKQEKVKKGFMANKLAQGFNEKVVEMLKVQNLFKSTK